MTCVKKDRATTCKYEGSRPSGNASAKTPKFLSKDVLLHRSDPGEPDLSHSLSHDSRERSLERTGRFERDSSPLILEKVVQLPSSVPEKALSVTEDPLNPVASSFVVLPSINFQTIPRPFRIPLPSERMQVSWVSGSDLDMTSYVFPPSFVNFLCAGVAEGAILGSRLRALRRLNTLGLYFTRDKQEALLHGDLSNAVVDRHFVYGLQVIGVHFYGVPEGTPAVLHMQARNIQMVWETLLLLNKTNQERTKAQALVLAVHAFIIVGFKAASQLYLLKACNIIEDATLRFLPESGPPPQLSDQVREAVSVLSQAIYLENYLYLTVGGPVPVKTARIEREFRSDLQVRVH